MYNINICLQLVKLCFIFRHELYHRNTIEHYFSFPQNRYSFQKKVLHFGVIGIKICQWMSQRVDIIKPNTLLTLEYFQNSVPPHTFEETLTEIENSTQQSWHTHFQHIDPNILGSGSISQVHQCVSKNGIAGVIKVMTQTQNTIFFTT